MRRKVTICQKICTCGVLARYACMRGVIRAVKTFHIFFSVRRQLSASLGFRNLIFRLLQVQRLWRCSVLHNGTKHCGVNLGRTLLVIGRNNRKGNCNKRGINTCFYESLAGTPVLDIKAWKTQKPWMYEQASALALSLALALMADRCQWLHDVTLRGSSAIVYKKRHSPLHWL